MFRCTEGGIREKKMQMEKKDRYKDGGMRTSTDTVTEVSIKFSRKESRNQKGGYEHRTETRSACNTGRKTGREESIHTRHRLIETGKQTRKVRE